MSNADLDPGYTITRYDHPSCELVNDWDGRIHGDLADAETELMAANSTESGDLHGCEGDYFVAVVIPLDQWEARSVNPEVETK